MSVPDLKQGSLLLQPGPGKADGSRRCISVARSSLKALTFICCPSSYTPPARPCPPTPVEPDDVTGDRDLIALHNLPKIAASVLSPTFRAGNYEAALPPGPSGRPEWRK